MANLTANLDLDQNTIYESQAISKTVVNGQITKVIDQVENGSTGVFDFNWTATGNSPYKTRITGKVGDASVIRTESWTTTKEVEPSSDGGITFTPVGNTNQSWGGSFTAQRYKTKTGGGTGQVGVFLQGQLIDGDENGTRLVSCTSSISGVPGTYSFTYTVMNSSGGTISFSWAGFSATLNDGQSFTQSISSSILKDEVVAGATFTFNPGSPGATDRAIEAHYWARP